jgi:hypothetical protein
MIDKRRVLFSAAALAACAALSGATSHAAVIAHWSFDTPTITTDPGDGHILTAADATANHNATSVINGAGATINSVAGQFGQAAQFVNVNANGQAQGTNNASLSFPQLTEIMGASGGDFTVAAWVNVPDQTSWDDNPILLDWGNVAAGTGVHRFTYWFQLDNVDSNAGLRPRAQLRFDNGTDNGGDIVATTLNASQAGSGTPAGATTFDDGIWHHLAWTWTKSTGQMRFYTDGVLRQTQTSTQTGANLDILTSSSPVGALGAKRDNNRYFFGTMDEVWVVGRALGDAEVATLQTTNRVVPEPASIILMMAGLGVAAAVRRRDIRLV